MGIFDGWFKREARRLVEREGGKTLIAAHQKHLRAAFIAEFGRQPTLGEEQILRCGARGLIEGIL